MIKDMLLVIGPIAGTIIGVAYASRLESRRRKEVFAYETKKKAYVDFITAVATDFILDDDSMVQLLSDSHYSTKMKIRMGRVFGPARLASNQKLTEKIRKFSDLRFSMLNMVDHDQNTDVISQQAADLGREIEQDMKSDLGLT